MKKGTGKLQIELTLSQKKVKSFLEAKYRKHKSQKTVDKYGIALAHFQTFLSEKHKGYTLESILPLLSKKKIPVYPLLNDFVEYLEDQELSNKSIVDYMTGVRSFLLFESEYEVDISRFRDRVSLPSPDTEQEKAIDATTIRRILKSCNNRRLKAFLYVLATSGLRSMEAVSLRLKDVELSEVKGEPSIIHVRKEFSKARRTRSVFISDEATEFLRQWLEYKYRKRVGKGRAPEKEGEHIIFSYGIDQKHLPSIYMKLREGFNRLLEILNLDKKKEGMLRRTITFHSFRRFVKTTIADQVGLSFAEYILGHKKDMGYYTKTAEGSLENYKKVMPQLTFLNFEQLETTGKNIQKQLDQSYSQISELNKKIEALEDTMELMQNQIEWADEDKVKTMAHDAMEKAVEQLKKTAAEGLMKKAKVEK
jgi:integrase/outer membrane murein-binding lipoprotein Lpp